MESGGYKQLRVREVSQFILFVKYLIILESTESQHHHGSMFSLQEIDCS